MRTRLLAIVSFFILCFAAIPLSVAGPAGDIDADGKIGLPEAINALTVTAGLRTAASDTTYDIADYHDPSNSTYTYTEEKFISATGAVFKTVFTNTVADGTVSGRNLQIFSYNGGILKGIQQYQIFDGQNVTAVGTYVSGIPATFWYTPGYRKGGPGMRVGDVVGSPYINDWGTGKRLAYREDLFLGTEDVTVPAGRFDNCLKIRTRVDTGDFYIAYLARNVGLVKIVGNVPSGSTPYSYIWELISATVDGSPVPPEGVNICSAQGQWTQPSGAPTNGNFSFYFNSQKQPIYLTLVLDGLAHQPGTLYLFSSDGSHFIADSTVYGTENLPDITLTLGSGAITGTYTYPSGASNVDVSISGTYSCGITP